MKYLILFLVLSACAAGQSVVLAPPAQQEHHAEHVGTFAITYVPPMPANETAPTVVVDAPDGPLYCYASTDYAGTVHSYCEGPRNSAEHSKATLYLRNFHGVNGAFTALLAEGSKCDPLRVMLNGAIAAHLDSVTFDYKEGRNAISVACTYADAKGKAKQGAAKYDIIAAVKP